MATRTLALLLPLLFAAPLFSQTPGPVAPSADEQLAVYEINRARSDPQRYATEHSLGNLLAGITPAPPLAINENLVNSARFHSAEMAANGYFGHQSAVTGDWPNLMVRNAGYPLRSSLPVDANNVESIAARYAGGASVSYSSIAAIKALIEDANTTPPGHRYHLLATGPAEAFYRQFREIGCGYAEGIGAGWPSGAYWSIHTGMRDASADNPWLTGVVFNDTNSNGRYDLNEGIGGATISVTGAMTTSTVTNARGGWSIEVTTTGTFDLTCSGGGFAGTATANTTVGADNVEVDFLSGDPAGEVNFGNQTVIPPAAESSDDGGGGCTTGTGPTGWFWILPLLLFAAVATRARVQTK